MIKGDMRKAALLKTAEELFFTRGYAATTINDILENQHCSKGSFYHHFESKLDVLTALCRADAERAYERYARDAAETEDPLDKLNLLLSASFPVQEAEKNLCALLMQLIATPEGEQVLSVLFGELRLRFFDDFCQLTDELARQERAFLPIPGIPALVFGAYQTECRQMLKIGADMAQGKDVPPQEAADSLRAIRYLMERTMDLPFGTIHVADAAQADSLLRACAAHARSVQKDAPTAPAVGDHRQMSMLQ